MEGDMEQKVEGCGWKNFKIYQVLMSDYLTN